MKSSTYSFGAVGLYLVGSTHRYFMRLMVLACLVGVSQALATDLTLRYIPVPAGPEDLALDLATGGPRLIVSSDDRLAKKGRKGVLGYIDLRTSQYKAFTVDGVSPEKHRPHGISFVSRPANSGKPFLYVIEHAPADFARGEQIIRYTVESDRLTHRTALPQSKLLTDPNDLVAAPDGRVFVTNNPKSVGMGLITFLFRIPMGDVLSYNPSSGSWSRLVNNRYRYANGIRLEDDTLTVSTVFSPQLATISAATGAKIGTAWRGAKSLDNISPDGGRAAYLHLTGVESFWKFSRSSRNGKRSSPTRLYRVSNSSPTTRSLETAVDGAGNPIFCDAASVCIEHDHKLYVGSIFKPWVTEIQGHQWKALTTN